MMKANKNMKNKKILITYCCIDCGGLISKTTALKGNGICRKCYHLSERIIYCCVDCGDLISTPTALKGEGRCKSCSRKGELSWAKSHIRNPLRYKIYYCKYPDCNKIIHFHTALFGTGYCPAHKQSKERNHQFGKRGKLCPNFGKIGELSGNWMG